MCDLAPKGENVGVGCSLTSCSGNVLVGGERSCLISRMVGIICILWTVAFTLCSALRWSSVPAFPRGRFWTL